MGITLYKKKLSKDRYSLYLNIYFKGKRKRESLGIILESESVRENLKSNKDKLKIAKSILLKRQLDFLKYQIFGKEIQIENMTIIQDSQTNIIKVFRSYVNQYTKQDIRLVEASLSHLCKFCSSGILYADQINKKFCNGFLEYLYKNLHGNTPSHYFKKFKQFLNHCVEEGYLTINPAQSMHASQNDAITKNILTAEEINKLAITSCNNSEVKRAFLFACHSGLRWCDIVKLKYTNVDFSARILTIVQQKVASHSNNAVLHLYLNDSAMRLIGSVPLNHNKIIFNLPSHAYALRLIKEWTIKAGIKKHISFHCARHTFITLLMANGAGIKTVASLAGHSSTRHTEKYIHIIDEQKRQAVENLPQLPENCII